MLVTASQAVKKNVFPSHRRIQQLIRLNSIVSLSPIFCIPVQRGIRIYLFIASDRHDCAIGVVALIPTFQDRDTKIGALASESVTTPGHVPNSKQDSHHAPILPKKKGNHAKPAGFACFERSCGD